MTTVSGMNGSRNQVLRAKRSSMAAALGENIPVIDLVLNDEQPSQSQGKSEPSCKQNDKVIQKLKNPTDNIIYDTVSSIHKAGGAVEGQTSIVDHSHALCQSPDDPLSEINFLSNEKGSDGGLGFSDSQQTFKEPQPFNQHLPHPRIESSPAFATLTLDQRPKSGKSSDSKQMDSQFKIRDMKESTLKVENNRYGKVEKTIKEKTRN